MARFDVHEMRAQTDVPLVVDVQADLLENLRTRVVIPILPMADAEDEVAARLKPVVDVAGEIDDKVLLGRSFSHYRLTIKRQY